MDAKAFHAESIIVCASQLPSFLPIAVRPNFCNSLGEQDFWLFRTTTFTDYHEVKVVRHAIMKAQRLSEIHAYSTVFEGYEDLVFRG